TTPARRRRSSRATASRSSGTAGSSWASTTSSSSASPARPVRKALPRRGPVDGSQAAVLFQEVKELLGAGRLPLGDRGAVQQDRQRAPAEPAVDHHVLLQLPLPRRV